MNEVNECLPPQKECLAFEVLEGFAVTFCFLLFTLNFTANANKHKVGKFEHVTKQINFWLFYRNSEMRVSCRGSANKFKHF
jgi:hypothetical protein